MPFYPRTEPNTQPINDQLADIDNQIAMHQSAIDQLTQIRDQLVQQSEGPNPLTDAISRRAGQYNAV